MIGLDFETIGLTPERDKLRLVQWANGRGSHVYDAWDPKVDLDRVLATLATKKMVAHNADFEEAWFRAYGHEVHLDDTLVMSRVLYGGTDGFQIVGHKLEDLALRELGIELDKEQQTSNWAAPVLSEEQLEYARRDAEVTLALYERLKARLEAEGLWKVYELENRVRPAVAAMERRGVAIHKDLLEGLIKDVTQMAESLKAELEAEWGINPGSGKQLIEHFKLEGRKDWPPDRRGAERQEVGRVERDREDPLHVRQLHTRQALPRDGRLRARFNAFGTAMGRFSSRGLGYAA